jgi:hypothetical protein
MFRVPRPINRDIIYFEGNKVMLFFVSIYFRLKGYLLCCPTSLSLHVSAVHGHHQMLSILPKLFHCIEVTYRV